MVTETVSFFYEIVMKKSPNYLSKYVSAVHQSTKLEIVRNVHICKTEYFANSYFPYTIKEWNNLSPKIRKLASNKIFMRPTHNGLINISHSLGIKLLTALREP